MVAALRGLEVLVTPQDPPAYGGTGCVSFLRTSSLTRNVRGKSFLKNERCWFLSAGLLLEVCCFFNVSKIHLTSMPAPCKYNCNSQEASVPQNSHAAHRTLASRIIFIPWFQSQAREQVYERLMPPYMAAVSSYFLHKLHFSFCPYTPSSPSIPEMQLQEQEGEGGRKRCQCPLLIQAVQVQQHQWHWKSWDCSHRAVAPGSWLARFTPPAVAVLI